MTENLWLHRQSLVALWLRNKSTLTHQMDFKCILENNQEKSNDFTPHGGLWEWSGNDRQNGANPHEYRLFDLSLCRLILDRYYSFQTGLTRE